MTHSKSNGSQSSNDPSHMDFGMQWHNSTKTALSGPADSDYEFGTKEIENYGKSFQSCSSDTLSSTGTHERTLHSASVLASDEILNDGWFKNATKASAFQGTNFTTNNNISSAGAIKPNGFSLFCVVLEFDLVAGPALKLWRKEDGCDDLPFDALTNLPLLALPDRADTCDEGVSYFMLRQAPVPLAGVSCYEHRSLDSARRNKTLRALCVLCDIPVFGLLHDAIQPHVSKILWMGSEGKCSKWLDKVISVVRFAIELSMLSSEKIASTKHLTPPIHTFCDSDSLALAIGYLGGARSFFVILKCIILGNTGIIITGPQSESVSKIILALASVLPKLGGFVGESETISSIFNLANYSAGCIGMIERTMLIRNACRSRMIFKPYCTLLDLNDLAVAYAPRRTSRLGVDSGYNGNCGYLVGAANPMIAAQLGKDYLSDLIVSLTDEVLKPEWTKLKSRVFTRKSIGQTQVETVVEEQLNQSINKDMSKLSLFRKKKKSNDVLANSNTETIKDRLVLSVKNSSGSPVTLEGLTNSGRASIDLDKHDLEVCKLIDLLVYKTERKSIKSSHSSVSGSFLTANIKSSRKAESYDCNEIDFALRKLIFQWLNGLFENVSVKKKKSSKSSSNNNLYLIKLRENIGDIKKRSDLSIRIVNFDDGDQFTGELATSDKATQDYPSDKSDVRISYMRNGIGMYTTRVIDGVQWKYEGSWKDDLQWGHGRISRIDIPGEFEFEGFFVAGVPSGEGRCQVQNKGHYSGGWVDGLFNGRGLLVDADDCRYEGNFERGLRTGISGKWTEKECGYEGKWLGDAPSGIGRAILCDGSMYLGNWMNGKRDGNGSWSCPKHCRSYKGYWHKDHRHGNGKYTFVDKPDQILLEIRGSWIYDQPSDLAIVQYMKHGDILFDGVYSEFKKIQEHLNYDYWYPNIPALDHSMSCTVDDFIPPMNCKNTSKGFVMVSPHDTGGSEDVDDDFYFGSNDADFLI